MTEANPRPALDWSGKAPFPFTRESSIRVDADGGFWHEGQKVEHPGLARAMASWVSRHPTDGRWVLENGYDWCYLTVDDVPLLVRGARVEGDALYGVLSDGSEERLDPSTFTVDEQGTLRCTVKPTSRGGPYPAKLARHAQLALADRLAEQDGHVVLELAGRAYRLS